MKNEKYIGFADLAAERRKVKTEFFDQVNTLIDWRLISNIINKYYQKGESVSGRPAYEGLLLFKICLLQTWYNLSDYEVEDQVNDRISFSRFVGLSIDDQCPDHSVISRFRTELTQKNAYEKLFKAMNKQLEKKKILVKGGVIVDASITDSPRKPKGKTEYEIVEDRHQEPKEEEREKEASQFKLIKKTQPGVDSEGRWVKKAGKLRFGYKKHTVTDVNGLILGVLTTSANVNEISNLEQVLDTCELAERTWVKADKGYKSKKNDTILQQKRLRNHIMNKAAKNRKLTEREIQFNKIVSKTRYKVERTFGSIKRWFGGGVARYVGLSKMHTQHLMEAIAYNLYRSPGIIMSQS